MGWRTLPLCRRQGIKLGKRTFRQRRCNAVIQSFTNRMIGDSMPTAPLKTTDIPKAIHPRPPLTEPPDRLPFEASPQSTKAGVRVFPPSVGGTLVDRPKRDVAIDDQRLARLSSRSSCAQPGCADHGRETYVSVAPTTRSPNSRRTSSWQPQSFLPTSAAFSLTPLFPGARLGASMLPVAGDRARSSALVIFSVPRT